MQNYTDEQLVSNYLKGEKKALEILVSQYLKPIYNFVYRYVGNSYNAEDIVQEVFVKMWRNLKKFDQSRKFKTWIFCIAKNASIDFLRKKKAIPFSVFDNEEGKNLITDNLIDQAPLPEEIFDRKNLAQELASAIDKLSLKYRMVLFLHCNDHFTFQEIAQSLEEPIDTIKSRYRRALIMLKKIIL